ncbi:solute carrier family 32 (vesicular inhibitory amino acid transporter) [Geosmithia morbida]|uniref:Solute carrier family 32 (Vesicular inhibitory amino acid transporter) n=1 Tax=Geosmithia morbida TaxID=1094350 RepID=A0A9P4YNM5_9HYPO|nr:solute carrier family 32 (vesicular inhibitory amino acid transporter) [Geosmithia morbida]KAF4120278.1 solute carrier family 32 (vesicular inhibitory amino acid transporter) [Geosmithia morbida]
MARNPTSWDEYEGRFSPSGSVNSTILSEEQALADDGDDAASGTYRRPRRRSSTANRLAAMADIGGVNSIRSFARSWQRAAGFAEVIPRRPSFVWGDHAIDGDDGSHQDGSQDIRYGKSHVGQGSVPPASGLLRQHFEASPPEGRYSSLAGRSAVAESSTSVGARSGNPGREDFRDRERKALDAEIADSTLLGTSSGSSRLSIFANPPHLATSSIIGSYDSYRGSHYGTMDRGSIRARRPSVVRPGTWDDNDDDAALGEHEPILVREVKKGDKTVLTVEGQSTLPQSVFNSINAIIGVGILSLPLAFKMSGWIIGLVLLTLIGNVTAYTGKLLARCMDYDPSLITYSDLAYVSFGTHARVIVSALFSLELLAANTALIILFADTVDLLLSGVASVNFWKCVCALMMLLLNLMPLRFLSYTSVIGIFSTFCIVSIVVIDGFAKEHTPGSLREPATTYLLPSNWLALPLAYGLLASPWGAHSVFPSIYRDMRHPAKWGKAIKSTFSFTYLIDTCLAIVGIIMFGDGITGAITSNILRTPGYPKALSILICVFVAIIPLTKLPLNCRPLVTTADVILGVHEHQSHAAASHDSTDRQSAFIKAIIRGAVRVTVVLIHLLISVAIPAFDSVCAFLGAALCTLISIILPVSFYLKLYWDDISYRERFLLWSIMVVFSILGVIGTVWTFLPKSLVGA